ncbi:MAG: acyltransferase [Eubacterium sp.]|nr:acyltransferase [Eubacterium sp.]
MQIFNSVEELESLKNNKIIGSENLKMNNSRIMFGGTGNILIVEEGVTLNNSKIEFRFDNSVVYLSSSKHVYYLNVTVYRESVCFIGKNNYMNGALNIIASERRHVFIGDSGLFSFGVWIRTADPHLIYSTVNKKRINPSKSVYIGDHVWLGQNVLVLKGTRICSGSIIGAGAVCTGKETPSNEAWGGNPAHRVSKDLFWDSGCVHGYTYDDTESSGEMNTDKYIFKANAATLPFAALDEVFSSERTPEEKLEYIESLIENKTKDRFASKGNASAALKRRINKKLRGKK